MKDIYVRWCVGRVVNVDDPEQGGRVRVRLHGIHEESPEVLPEEFLPWARLTLPPTSACTSEGVGVSPTGPVVGADFIGVALDSMYQNIMVLGTWWGSTTESTTIPPLARGVLSTLAQQVQDNRLLDIELGSTNRVDEPPIVRNTQYPLNDVTVTRGGQEEETDNTEGVRVTKTHPSGNYTNLDTEGNATERRQSVFSLVVGRFVRRVGGSLFRSVGGNLVDWVALNLYQRAAQQLTHKSQSHLVSSELVELQAQITKIRNTLEVESEVKVPTLRVTNLIAENITTPNVIQGTVAYADQAGLAGSTGMVTPVTGNGPGAINVTFDLTDNGGDYPLN